ncbi:PHB depolymerase family esterase [Pelomonas sp. SE-A7]|uniref:extracellular catalytic domain type 1 short-chain-length polyhydroxyalkanoate depolymerase n=1 Tax=Pelomonas sp. SE-A7 TaxID=3054953 RepID=UPI00259C6E5B|nr:PHB depolymerase family esterase [Pelomonas sp. SE-A7]MDM4766196.1 PHB depolymerase family esterase [Pelomonas sp. SE-A7]
MQLLPLTVFFVTLAAGLFGPAAAQDATLRERLRERMQARQAEKQPAPPAGTLGPGTHELSVQHAGQTRRFLLHIPKTLQPAGQPTPLLIAMHGGGGNMRFQADDENYGLISKSEQAGFLVAFPNGLSPLPGGGLATWNAGNCCAQARDKGSDDVGFIRAMLAEIEKRQAVDTRRVYATGMSNGGMMAHRLACEMADRISAIAAVAGTDNTRACSPSRPVPVLIIHARNDDHVLFEGGAGEKAFRDRSQVTEFTSVAETAQRWMQRNRCDAASPAQLVLKNEGAVCERHAAGCAGGAVVEVCTTETGGHSWPGAGKVRRGKEAASQALSANNRMWEFFQQVVPPR